MIRGYFRSISPAVKICFKWICSPLKHCKGRDAGFTIVEILLVISITCTLCGIAIPSYKNYLYKARVTKAVVEIRLMEKEVWGYQLDLSSQTLELRNENLPDSLEDINCDYILDPWGRPYEYQAFKEKKDKGKMRLDRHMVPVNTDFDLFSKGRDGKSKKPLMNPSSHDDILRASNGAFVGLASEF